MALHSTNGYSRGEYVGAVRHREYGHFQTNGNKADLNRGVHSADGNLKKFDLWLTLGDAYQRSDRVREALSAYLKAQELLG